ncbi:hypothetical protein FZC66_13735 [Priestia megaterium]|nr:hypothetical protein FZC66_13735 [Priestia megaterium]
MRLLLLMIAVPIILTACNEDLSNNPTANQEREGEEYEEFTDQNPNFLNTTSERTKVKDDYEKIKEIIEVETPYEPGNVIISGRDAWVTIHSDENYSRAEKQKVIKQMNHILYKGLPRLKFHVNIE